MRYRKIALVLVLGLFVAASSSAADENLEPTQAEVEQLLKAMNLSKPVLAEMLSLEQDITAIDESINQTQASIDKIEATIKELNEEAANIEDDATQSMLNLKPEELDKYATSKVDVSSTEVENGIPYQKDIFEHAKELYEGSESISSQPMLL